MNSYSTYCWSFLLCLLSIATFAQEQRKQDIGIREAKEILVQAGFMRGTIFQHTPKFLPKVTQPSMLYELALVQDTNGGSKTWHRLHNSPSITWSFIYGRYGDKEIFGQSYSILPSLTFYTRTKHFNVHYRIGAGLGYFTKHYHAINNPTNNVIGSPFNNITAFQLGIETNFNAPWQLMGTLSFTHYSNGRVQMPNLGINVPGYGLLLRYYPKGKQQFVKDKSNFPSVKRAVLVDVKLGHGFRDGQPAGGPKFSVFVGELMCSRRMNLKWRLLAGLEANYYMGSYHYVFNQVSFQEKEEWKPLKIASYLGAEVYFGQLSVIFTSGYYIYDPFSEKSAIPTKLGVQYYLRPTYTRLHRQLYFGVYLKAHLSNADYIALGVGYTL